MASKNVFKTGAAACGPATDTVNEAGGQAYSMDAKSGLAQMAVTGCFGNTYYASGESQVDKVKELASQCDPDFVGKVAIYAREKGLMKDMPAFLVALIMGKAAEAAKAGALAAQAKRGAEAVNRPVAPEASLNIEAFFAQAEVWNEVLWETFPRVVDGGKMLRNVVQIIRSGAVGRKSFGQSPKRLFKSWFDTHDDEFIFRNCIGNDPSMADVIKLIRPVPMTKERAALYAWLLDKPKGKFEGTEFETAEALPEIVAKYEAFKKAPNGEIPKVPFEMLLGLPLSDAQWKALAIQATWNQTRMNLNNFLKHGALKDAGVLKVVTDKLRNPDLVRKAKAFPYQLMTAYLNVSDEMPREVTNALQDAMEVATENVPKIDGLVCVLPDVSGSMSSPVTGTRVNPKTGKRETHTTKARCIDVAALVAASFLRMNPDTVVIPFEQDVVRRLKLNPRDSVMTNAQKLASIGGGGTNCSAALKEVNEKQLKPALCVFVSDNESWVDSRNYGVWGGSRTATMAEWNKVVRRAPQAKLVCIDIQAYTSTQAKDQANILNVGGFADSVFEVVAAFASGGQGHWVDVIEAVA